MFELPKKKIIFIFSIFIFAFFGFLSIGLSVEAQTYRCNAYCAGYALGVCGSSAGCSVYPACLFGACYYGCYDGFGTYPCDVPGQICVCIYRDEPCDCGPGGTQICNNYGCQSPCESNDTACTPGVTNCCSGYCVDGVCCNNSCTGTCRTCYFSATYKGTCYYWNSGTDPDSECYGTGTCGGTCNGSGSCQFPSTSVSCGTKDCDYLDSTCRNYHDVTRYCNGAGSCSSGTCNSYTNRNEGTACGSQFGPYCRYISTCDAYYYKRTCSSGSCSGATTWTTAAADDSSCNGRTCKGSGTCACKCNTTSSCICPGISTTCGTKDCDYLDTTCRNYHDVNRYCDGNGGCAAGTCNSYTNRNEGTACGSQLGPYCRYISTCDAYYYKNTCSSGSCSGATTWTTAAADDSSCNGETICKGSGTCACKCNTTSSCICPGTSVTCSGLLDCDYLNYYYQSPSGDSPTGTDKCWYRDYVDTYRYCNGAGSCSALNCSSYSDPYQYECGDCKYIPSNYCTGDYKGSCVNYELGAFCGTNKECNGSGNCVDCAYPTGTISASKTSVETGEQFTISITGYDDNDVWKITYNKDSNVWNATNEQTCLLQQYDCTKSWNITESTAGTYTYYGRVRDSDDVHGCSGWHEAGIGSVTVTVTQIDPPTARTDPATNVEETTATLRGAVTDMGGADYRIRFNYGDTSSYGSNSSWTGYYSYTTPFTWDKTGLTRGKTYHFRIQAENSAGYGYGLDKTFITKPDSPSGLTATAVSSSQINLSWSKGSGAYYTMIRRKTGSYPTSPGDGTQAYYGTETSKSDTGLTTSTTYYYRAWSRAYEETLYQYSDSYDSSSATTFSGVCSSLSYPTEEWQRVWYNDPKTNGFTQCIGDGPDEPSEEFDTENTWDVGNLVGGYKDDHIGFTSSRSIYFKSTGFYNVCAGSDDGLKLWIDTDGNGSFGDGELIINRWVDRSYVEDCSFNVKIEGAGYHKVRLDYYENADNARVSFDLPSKECVGECGSRGYPTWGSGCSDEVAGPMCNTACVTAGYCTTGVINKYGCGASAYWGPYGTDPHCCCCWYAFEISTNPFSGSVPQGGSVPTTLAFDTPCTKCGSCDFSASGLPAGASLGFVPGSCDMSCFPSPEPCYSTMIINTSLSTPIGTYPITIFNNDPDDIYYQKTKSATYTLTVTEAEPDLTITNVELRDDKMVHYIIKNRGDALAGGSSSSLYVGGVYQTYDSVGSLSAGESRPESFSAWTCTPCQTYEIEVCADKDNTVEESDEGNNCLTETIHCPGKPDLVINDFNDDDKDGIIEYIIKNRGEVDAEGSYTRLYIDDASKETDYISSLSIGSSTTSSFSYNWIENCTDSSDTIKICADDNHDIEEEEEGNNCRTEIWDCLQPDLISTNISSTDSTIRYTIENQGDAEAGESDTKLYVDGALKGSDPEDSLSAGSSRSGSNQSFSYNWIENCTDSSDTIKVCADDNDEVEESNEDNNCDEETWNCGCLINEVLYDNGEYNLDNKCQVCDTSQNKTDWSNVPDGTDPAGWCSPTWSSCDSKCLRKGGDGNCYSGACDTNHRAGNILSGYICGGSGNQAPVSSTIYCYYDEDCEDGKCSATKWWTSCNGGGSCRDASDRTDSYSEPVYASAGCSLTSSCGDQCDPTIEPQLCDPTWKASTGEGDNYYGKGGDYNCQGMCDGSGLCEYAVNCSPIDTTPPTTGITIIRTATGDDVTTAGYWLRADNYTIQFEDKDQAEGSGLNCENCTCEYSIYACDVGGTNCTTQIEVLNSRNCNDPLPPITAGTSPCDLEGLGRYRIYSGATDNADNSGTDYKYLNFDFTPPETRIE